MQSFDTPGSVLLTIDCPVGEVDVTTHDAPRTEVDVTALKNDDTTREAVENTRVELRETGDGHEVRVEVPRRNGSFFGREPKIRVAVRAPHGAALAFRTASADVDAHGRLGAVRGKTASGDVEVEAADEVSVTTASGDLRFREVRGNAELRAVSGDISVGRVGGELAAGVVSGDLRVTSADRGGAVSAVSGDIALAAVTSGDVDLTSVSGDVTVGIREGSRVHVDVTTVSGDLRSDLDLGDAPPSGDGPLVEIRGRTVSGDLRVRRAAAVPV
jgi:hypothetical protein